MGVSPAEPLGNTAAELTLEFDVVSSMLATVLDASAYTFSRALAADQLFRLVVLVLVVLVLVSAVLHPSEVRLFALKALVVAELGHRVPLQVIIIDEARIL